MTQPSYTEILGYDPSAGSPSAYGIGSRDQWVAPIAATWHLQYTNGMELSGGWGPGGLFSNEFVDSIGINFRLNPADLGIATRDGTPDPQTYQMFVRMAEWVFDNYDSLPQGIRQEILAPTTPG